MPKLLSLVVLICAAQVVIPVKAVAFDDDAAKLEARSAGHPFDDELRVLAQDLSSPVYRKVLDTMIPTDLEAEWLRVATADNYQTFLAKHGGTDKVLADPKLKAAYEVRREIADRFIALVQGAYDSKQRKPPFDREKIDDLCAKAARGLARSAAGSAVALRTLMPAPGSERNWPQFRGPAAQGIVLDPRFPLKWSATENVVWKTPLPGAGNSSPVVWGDRLFVTAASKDGKDRWLLCYALDGGKLRWQHAAPPPGEKVEKLYWKNTYATSTPVTDGERVVAFFGNSGLVCCDLDGKELWRRDLGAFTTMHGPGTSPIIYHDKVIFLQDQHASKSVFVAFDKRDGSELWRRDRESAACWSTPVVVRAGNRDEVLYNGSHHLVAYDPESGGELWRLAGPSRESIPQPVIGGGLIFSASGRNGPILAVRPGGEGDVTATHALWNLPRGGSHVPTPVYVASRLFMVNDVGLAMCLDAETGRQLWQQRLPGRFTMSLLSAGDKLLATNETGVTFILKAADRFEQLAENDLGEAVLATPAILGGRIYFRTAENLICIGPVAQ